MESWWRKWHNGQCSKGCELIHPQHLTVSLHFFRNLEMGWKDIIYPKRYIYKYLRELMGNKNYKRIYLSQDKNNKASINDISKWEKNIIENTMFGQQLLFETSKEESYIKSFVKNNNLQYLLSLFWYGKIKKELEYKCIAVK